MATLTVWKFDTVDGADNALARLEALQREQLIEVLDGAVVRYPQGAKKPKTRQLHNTAGAGALGGAFWGMLFGLLFLNPLAGMAIGAVAGAGAGALSGSLSDYGIRDDFIKRIGETIPKGSSALCVLIRSVTEDKVIPEIEPYKPRVLKTSLSNEQEARLRAALGRLEAKAA